MSGKVKVTLVHSLAGTVERQWATVRALGLGKINSSNILPDRPEIRGMAQSVSHLVKMEAVKD